MYQHNSVKQLSSNLKKKKEDYLKKKNPPQYWGRGFDPWSGNSACELQLLSPRTRTRESAPQQCCMMHRRPDTDKYVSVWQKPLQYCKVISLQLIKINEKKRIKNKNK